MWGKFAIIKTQVTELQQLAFSKSDPAGAQTQNLQNRNLTLYSIELRGQEGLFAITHRYQYIV